MDPMMQLQAWVDAQNAPVARVEAPEAPKPTLPKKVPQAPTYSCQKQLEEAVSRGVMTAMMKRQMTQQRAAMEEDVREANFRQQNPRPALPTVAQPTLR